MKKFMKVCGIIFGILFVAGTALMAVGCMGGEMEWKEITEDSLKNIEKLTGSDFWWNEDWETYDPDDDSFFDSVHDVIRDVQTYDTAFAAGDVSGLKLELGGCKFVLGDSPDADYHVNATKISTLQVYVDRGILEVKAIRSGKWIGWNASTGTYVEVLVPRDARLTDVTLEFGAGEFEVGKLSCDNAKIDVGAGELRVTDLSAGKLECELGAGEMTVKNASVSGDAKLSVGMGVMVFDGSVPGNMEASCGKGSMEVTIRGSGEKDHNYTMECAAGNLTVGSQTIAGLAGEKTVENGAASTYELSCSMGNLCVWFEE